MEEEFRDLLRNDVQISEIVSEINWGQHPQGRPLPAIVLNNVSMQNAVTMDGRHSLTESRVQVDCYATFYSAAKTLGRVVMALCNGHRGGNFQGVFLIDASDSRVDQTSETSASQPFRVSLDFTVFHNQP